MLIGGWQRFSALDYPGKLSAIVFTQGCNFRCRFCYNPMLVWPALSRRSSEFAEQSQNEGGLLVSREKYKKDQVLFAESDFFDFLKTRINKLDSVVITGGEPTLQNDLPEFIRKIKELGFLVKLDTNGSNPEMLKKIIDQNLVDYLAMDVKAPFNKYDQVAGVKVDLEKIKQSLNLIINSNLPYELRTTVEPALTGEDLKIMSKELVGAKLWYWQHCQTDKPLVDEALRNIKSLMVEELVGIRDGLGSGIRIEVR